MNLWKVLDLATRPGKPSNKVFQCFSMVHFPICILTYHELWPLFLLYGETVALLRFFSFRVFPGSARALTMFPQLKHLRTSVHPKPPATHGHFGLCSFVQLRTYSLSSDSFLPSQLHFEIVTSTRAGTRVVYFVARAFTRNTENIRNWLIFLVFTASASCFLRLFVTVILSLETSETWIHEL